MIEKIEYRKFYKMIDQIKPSAEKTKLEKSEVKVLL